MLILWWCPIKANVDILIVVFNILCFNGGAYHKNVWRHINIIFLMKSAIKQLFWKVCDVAMQVSSVQQLPGARDGPRPQVAAVTQTLAGANEGVWEKGKQTLARSLDTILIQRWKVATIPTSRAIIGLSDNCSAWWLRNYPRRRRSAPIDKSYNTFCSA